MVIVHFDNFEGPNFKGNWDSYGCSWHASSATHTRAACSNTFKTLEFEQRSTPTSFRIFSSQLRVYLPLKENFHMGGLSIDTISLKHLRAAFLAMELPNNFVTLARQIGGGTISTEVQLLILEECIYKASKEYGWCNSTYVKNILKKVITAAESTSEDIVDGLYEQFSYYISLNLEQDILNEKTRISKQVSFLRPGGRSYDTITSDLKDMVITLECSLNMLEGDTGCALWPSSLFMSEVILSYPDTFSNKVCFEVGSGVGLVGISLIHVGASNVVLTDGDESSLANMRRNLERNRSKLSPRTRVECEHLQWESSSENKLQSWKSDIVLGADIIYDPVCLPHLIQVLSVLLSSNQSTEHWDSKKKPIAFIAQVIRNWKTFDYFLKLAGEVHICVDDITELMRPQNFLPYMLSYDRSSVRLFKLHKSSPR